MQFISFSEYVVIRRKRVNKTQKDLATALGYTPQALSRFESRNSGFPLSLIGQLCAFLECSLEDLFERNFDAPRREEKVKLDLDNLPKALVEARQISGLSQSDFASKVGISDRAVRNYERGDSYPSFQLIEDWATVAEVPAISLVTPKKEEPPAQIASAAAAIPAPIPAPVIETKKKLRVRPWIMALVIFALVGGSVGVIVPVSLLRNSSNGGGSGIVPTTSESTEANSTSKENETTIEVLNSFTKPRFELTTFAVDTSSLTYEVTLNDPDKVCEIEGVKIVDPDGFVQSLPTSLSGKAADLYSNHRYTFLLSYSYLEKEGSEKIHEELSAPFLTVYKRSPIVYITESHTKDRVDYEVSLVDDDKTAYLVSVSLYNDISNELVAKDENGIRGGHFDSLNYNCPYRLEALVLYNLNDGQGNQYSTSVKQFTTLPTQPKVEYQYVKAGKSKIVFSLAITDPDALVFSFVTSLYQGDNLITSTGLSSGSFEGLTVSTTYLLETTVTYRSGYNLETFTLSAEVTTLDEGSPIVSFSKLEREESILRYEISIDDPTTFADLISVSLYLGGDLVQENGNSLTGQFTGLDPSKSYLIVISYSYDLGDGIGIVNGNYSKSTPKTAYLYGEDKTTLLGTGSYIPGEQPTSEIAHPTKDKNEEQQLEYSFSSWILFEEDEMTAKFFPTFVAKTIGVTINDGEVFSYDGTSKDIVIPSIWEQEKITAIAPGSFFNSSITSIEIGEGVTEIGDNAFEECYNLSSITLPSTVKSLGAYSFAHTAALKSIDLPYGLEKIGMLCFFYGGLEEIDIPDSVTLVDYQSFLYCYYLKRMTLPNNPNTDYGDQFLMFAERLPYLYIPSETSAMSSSCVSSNVKLTLLTELETRKSEWEFYDLKSKIDIVYGYKGSIEEDGLTYAIGGNEDNEYATLLDVDENLVYATVKSEISGVKVETIANGKFSNHEHLKGVTIEEGIEQIGSDLFSSCHTVEWVVVPTSVSKIGERFYMGAENLLHVYYMGTPSEWASITQHETNIAENTLYYYSENEPSSSGNYWHYVNGVPTDW